MRIGLALNCSIAGWSRIRPEKLFLPGHAEEYQISQYDEPIAVNGWIDVEVPTPDGPRTVRVEIERAHMEEDTGKTLHVGGATGRIQGAEYSLVNYNRAGIPLIEVVTKPIGGTGALAPAVARAYVAELRALVVALGVSDAHMHQGSLRCDVNVSLRASPTAPLGTRTKTKNVNSLRSVERAVGYEMRRQAAVLDAGGRVVQETRHWHEDTGGTTSGRSKEQAEDYRYFPEPDLVPLAPSDAWIDRLRASRRSSRPHIAGGCRLCGVSTISRCSQCSMPARSRSSNRPLRRVRTPGRPGIGGWAICPSSPGVVRSSWPSLGLPPRRLPGSPSWSRRVR